MYRAPDYILVYRYSLFFFAIKPPFFSSKFVFNFFFNIDACSRLLIVQSQMQLRCFDLLFLFSCIEKRLASIYILFYRFPVEKYENNCFFEM